MNICCAAAVAASAAICSAAGVASRVVAPLRQTLHQDAKAGYLVHAYTTRL